MCYLKSRNAQIKLKLTAYELYCFFLNVTEILLNFAGITLGADEKWANSHWKIKGGSPPERAASSKNRKGEKA